MTVDEPPPDMDGTSEDPDAPRTIGSQTTVTATVVPEKKATAGYPTEEVLRPITLPRNMSEVSIGPHAALGLGEGPYRGSDTLRARYGITRTIQLGLQYALGGVYDDPQTMESKIGLHTGKALGLDVTVLLKDWIGVRAGIPIYIDRPVAVSLALGAPLRFVITDKLAIGGLDDVLNVALNPDRFAPTFEQEAVNASRSAAADINTILPRGYLRFAGWVAYQRDPKLAIIGRIGVTLEDFVATGTQSNAAGAGAKTHLRGGFQYTLKKYLDLGFALGFDDLSDLSSFGPYGHLAFRI
jgi:hypothetical protein